MYVVRHYHKFLRQDPDVDAQRSGAKPFILHDSADVIQMHFAVQDLAKQTCMAARANRHKIRPGPRVVVPAQTNRPPNMLVLTQRHVTDVLSAASQASFLFQVSFLESRSDPLDGMAEIRLPLRCIARIVRCEARIVRAGGVIAGVVRFGTGVV